MFIHLLFLCLFFAGFLLNGMIYQQRAFIEIGELHEKINLHNTSPNTVNFAYLKSTDMPNFNAIYNFLHEKKIAPEERLSITNIYLSVSPLQKISTNTLPAEEPLLKRLRTIFPNLKEITYFGEAQDLKIYKDYETFYYLLYDNTNNFNPLTLRTTNPQETQQAIKKNLLIWYKYQLVAPLLLMYDLVQSMGFCISILYYHRNIKILSYVIVRPLLSLAPIVSLVIGFCRASGPGGYLKKNHTCLGFNLKKSDFNINKSDLLVIIPTLLTLCSLILDIIIMNIPLKEFLCIQTSIILWHSITIYLENRFKYECLMYYLLKCLNQN